MKFEWDESKNLANIKKHGLSFEETVYVFSDTGAIALYDEEHSKFEERWLTLGKIINHGIIVVSHTDRIKGKKEYIRIISARKAEKHEEKEYLFRIGKN